VNYVRIELVLEILFAVVTEYVIPKNTHVNAILIGSETIVVRLYVRIIVMGKVYVETIYVIVK
jgi:hypothetical protein